MHFTSNMKCSAIDIEMFICEIFNWSLVVWSLISDNLKNYKVLEKSQFLFEIVVVILDLIKYCIQ